MQHLEMRWKFLDSGEVLKYWVLCDTMKNEPENEEELRETLAG